MSGAPADATVSVTPREAAKFVLIEAPIPAGTEAFEEISRDEGEDSRYSSTELRDDRAILRFLQACCHA